MSDDSAPDAPRLLNRELSWIQFNWRVLALAEDPSLPLLERAKFVAICARNLDEFFQIRVGGLQEQVDAGVSTPSADGRTPFQQLAEIRSRVLEFLERLEDVFEKDVAPELAQHEIRILRWSELAGSAQAELSAQFAEQIFPALTPLSVDTAHPFPYISNLSLNLALAVSDPDTGQRRFARVKIPPMFARFMPVPGGGWIAVEEVIAAHLDQLFPGMELDVHALFRLTLDGNLNVETTEGDDLLQEIESGLHRRLRMNDAVRLEVEARMPEELRRWLIEELRLDAEDVYLCRSMLDLGALWELHRLDRPDLKEVPWLPVTPGRLAAGAVDRPDSSFFADGSFFAAIREADLLVHHPYDSFHTSVEAFLAHAAADPHVLAIKTTVYRTSGPLNSMARALTRAAQSGKEVVALIELQARFDEGPNIEWARSLEQVGVHVVYGLVGLKTHGKVTMVVRSEPGGIRRYCHIATGNYNPATAKAYEDLGMFTAANDLGTDAGELFNYLTGASRPKAFRHLLVAPSSLRSGIIERIRAEAQQPDGRIVMKMNSLSDPEVIEALYDASQRGTEIDLIVRGICCLLPGIPGRSESIRVRSIVGRFLEHSRIYRFGSEARPRTYYIGSADMMPRNLDRRVEVLAPVRDPALQARLDEILERNLDPQARSWALRSDGTWHASRGAFHTQEHFQDLARKRA
jgi:polyphosphate kinase